MLIALYRAMLSTIRLCLLLGLGFSFRCGWLPAATWDGGLSHNNFTLNDFWSTPNNWVEGAAPLSTPTTDITFALSGIRTTTNQNILPNYTLRNLTFAAGSNVTALGGNALTIASGGRIAQNSSMAVRIAQPISFAAATNITGSGSARLSFDGVLSGSTAPLSLFGAPDHPGSLLVSLNAANTVSGLILGSESPGFLPVDLTLGNNGAAGAGTIAVFNGNTLRSAGGRTLTNGLVLSVQANGLPPTFTFGSGGDLTFNGPIGLGIVAKTLQVDNALTVFRGNLTGGARVTKTGSGILRLAGTDNSGFNGTYVIDEGQVQLKEANAAIASPIVINVPNGFDLQGNSSAAIGGLAGSGALTLDQATLTVGNTSFVGDYSGSITSASPTTGTLRVVGSNHELTLSGTSSFGTLLAETGTTILRGGASVSIGNGVTVGTETSSIAGTLTLRDGAVLSLGSSRTFGIIGPAGTGVIVIGAGSRLHAGFQIVVTGTGSDTARMTVANQGTVDATFGIIGAASSTGTGALEVLNGGQLVTAAGIIGFINNSPGVVRVSGGGAAWRMSVSLGMGGFSAGQRGGVGSLRIEPGGSVTATATNYWTANCRIDVAGGLLATGSLVNNVTGGGSAILALSDPDENNSALQIGTDGSSSNFTGTVTNSDTAPGGLTKVGSGTLTLSGPVSYTGRTRVLGGTMSVPQPNLFATLLEIGPGATFQLGGIWGTNGVSQTTIAANGRLIGSGILRGSVNNAGLIEVSGVQSLVVGGPMQNSGVLRVSNGASFTANQSFVNTGVIDLISAGNVSFPPNFTNNGVILDRNSVRVLAQPTPAGVHLTITAFAGHTYTLQRSAALDGSVFSDVSGSIFAPTDGTLVYTDTTPPPGKAFYRVRID